MFSGFRGNRGATVRKEGDPFTEAQVSEFHSGRMHV